MFDNRGLVRKNPHVLFYTFLAVGDQKNKTSLPNPPKRKTTRLPLLYPEYSYNILLYEFAIGQLQGFSFFRIQNLWLRYQSTRECGVDLTFSYISSSRANLVWSCSIAGHRGTYLYDIYSRMYNNIHPSVDQSLEIQEYVIRF